MINLELGELYGMKNMEELMQAIKDSQDMGMSDFEIQTILERSKNKAESKGKEMTKEEAILFVRKELRSAYERAKNVGYKGKTRYIEVLEMTIKILEQEPETDVLDKIRAEIEQIEIHGNLRDVECFSAGINAALNVIDKYRTESEG